MTDQYLQPGAAVYRLVEEFQKHNSLVVAYDFDNTVYDFHKKGKTYNDVIGLLQELKALGCTLVCWTANEDVDFVKQYCEENNIPLDILNENPSFWSGVGRKIYYNVLLDDRAGLLQVYNDLRLVVEITKKRKALEEFNQNQNDSSSL